MGIGGTGSAIGGPRRRSGAWSWRAGFDAPGAGDDAPGEPRRLYVVEQRGHVIRVVERGGSSGRRSSSTSVLGYVAGGEQGLLGLAFDPNYATNRFVYVELHVDGGGRHAIVRYRSNGARRSLRARDCCSRVDQPYGNHNGGGLAFGPDGMLYVEHR